MPSETPVDVEVTGTNFALVGMTAVWKNNASEQDTVIPAGQVRQKTDKQVTVTLVPGEAGGGTLTLVSPIGLRAHVDVTIKAKRLRRHRIAVKLRGRVFPMTNSRGSRELTRALPTAAKSFVNRHQDSSAGFQAKSNRSRFITLVQAATKSLTKVGCASLLA